MCPLRAAARLGALLDRKGVLKKDQVLAEIKSVTKQLAERTSALAEQQQEPFPQAPPQGLGRERLVDRILELMNAAGLTAHQAKNLLGECISSSSWVSH
jgi:hypothetical protein